MTSTDTRRIQRRRIKGWRASDHSTSEYGVRYVGRGTRWGNPNQIVPVDNGWLVNHDNGSSVGTFANIAEARRFAAEAYRAHLKANPRLADRVRAELAGRDLMCWCPLDEPCHADVLLEVANAPAVTPAR